MIIPDVNMVLYATMTPYPQHERAREWWAGILSGSESVGIPGVTLFGFLRLATSRRIYTNPMGVEAAAAVVESWMAAPNVRFLLQGPRHLEIALGLMRAVGTAGNLTTDVQLAAHALENQASLASNDTDFARFSGLRWVNPVA